MSSMIHLSSFHVRRESPSAHSFKHKKKSIPSSKRSPREREKRNLWRRSRWLWTKIFSLSPVTVTLNLSDCENNRKGKGGWSGQWFPSSFPWFVRLIRGRAYNLPLSLFLSLSLSLCTLKRRDIWQSKLHKHVWNFSSTEHQFLTNLPQIKTYSRGIQTHFCLSLPQIVSFLKNK
jgi:hypothetical protein